MAVAQRTRARIEGKAKRQGALIAGGVTAACLIALPPALIDLAVSSLGLSEMLPMLAPPIALPVRIVLALVGAAVAAALGAVASGTNETHGRAPVATKTGRKRNDVMGWTKSLGLHHLARLARGQDATPKPATGPQLVADNGVVDEDMLARRREDLHPDAPPRPILVASRDLPDPEEPVVQPAAPLALVETVEEEAILPAVSTSYASPVRDTTRQDRPRPLPRSPEPLSDSDLGWMRDLLAERDAKIAGALVGPMPDGARPMSEDSAPDGSLLSMLDRFEQGVSHRIALRDAASAMARVEESLPVPPVAIVTDPVVAIVDEDRAVDDALGAALETLRRLSTKAG